jgi:serine/threonine protein kinase
MTRFFDALKKTDSFQNVRLSAKICDSVEGGWSNVNFYKVLGVNFSINRITPPAIFPAELEVAVTTFKQAEDLYFDDLQAQMEPARTQGLEVTEELDLSQTPDEEALWFYQKQIKIKKDEMHASMNYLAKTKLPERFNLVYLAWHSSGQKISIKGVCDFHDFIFKYYDINEKYLSLEAIRRFIAQMILSVLDLHERDLVHRDIKLENFIVFKYDDKFFLKLSDHIEAIHQDDKSLEILGSPDCMALELIHCWNMRDIKKYNSLAKKPIDCYALGASLQKLLEIVFYFKGQDDSGNTDLVEINRTLVQDPELAKLISLIEDLTHPEIDLRDTLVKAKQNSFFGANSEECDAYFEGLIEEASNYRFLIDGNPLFHDTHSGNYYQVLDTKSLLANGIIINNLINESAHHVKVTEEDIQKQTNRLCTLESYLNDFILSIESIIKQRDYKTDFDELKAAAIEELEHVHARQENLRVTKILYSSHQLATQLPNTWAQRLFSQPVIEFQQFDAKLREQAKLGDYASLIEMICNLLGDEDKLLPTSLHGQYKNTLTQSLGISVYEAKRDLENTKKPPQWVA